MTAVEDKPGPHESFVTVSRAGTWLVLGLLPCLSLPAAVRLPAVFGDGMVLQRDVKLPIWGWADPGEEVEVSFHDSRAQTVAGPNGTWRLYLPAQPTRSTGGDFRVRGQTTLVLHDVVVGDVWLAAGQSNMAFPLANTEGGERAVAGANDPLLRLFLVNRRTHAEPQADIGGSWTTCRPETAADFSALAYFFGREIRGRTGVPIGLVEAAWGGTPARSWMSLGALRASSAFAPEIALWEAALARHRDLQVHPAAREAYAEAAAAWRQEVRPDFLQRKKAYTAAELPGHASGPRPQPSRPEPLNPDPTDTPGESVKPITPCVVFNAMIAPLARFPVRGVLWYQGERDEKEGPRYRELLWALLADWRRAWGSPGLPFIVVQLPGYDAAPGATWDRHAWPWVREAQASVRAQPASAMAVAIDVGAPRDVHPRNKEILGRRVALAARRLVYGEAVESEGPALTGHVLEPGQVRLRFTGVGLGLVIGQSPWRTPGMSPLPHDELAGFVAAGSDRRWLQAQARIEGQEIVVSCREVAQPVAVRYAWENFPRGNLYNRDGLPAAPFRTDDWPAPQGLFP